jgi:hypothetical protein
MRRTIFCVVFILFTSRLGDAQTLTRDLYAAVTPLTGAAGSVITTETLLEATIGGIAQTHIGPSPILTNGVVPVTVGPPVEIGTVLVFVNTSLNTATVNLSFSNSAGVEIAHRTILVAKGSQFSQPANALVADQFELSFEIDGLLTISSDIPVAMLALDFRGVGLTTIPITSLFSSTPSSTFTMTTTQPNFTIPSSTGPVVVASGAGVIIIPNTIQNLPTTIACIPTTIAPTTTSTFGNTGTFRTGTFTTPPRPDPVVPSDTVPSGSALIFPAVALGERTVTNFTIGNVSTLTQAVRIDLFASDGTLVRSFPSIRIPPHGLVVFSVDSAGILAGLE